MRYLKLLLAFAMLPLAGWWWFESNVFITEWLLGHSEGFQRFVIWMISTLQSSGYVTILVLGTVYVLASLLEIIFWPTGTLTRRWGASALIFWLAVAALEAIGIFNGYSIRYFGMFAIDGQPPPEWGRWLSGVPLALLFAIGPEGLIRWSLLTMFAWGRQFFTRPVAVGEG
ncbi:hypothetical protein A6A03_04305 [Chloroflexus islandicus]|uniref:Uncharacterized protein n=1 Tax=Chloroflexus islandicus TaxID=1707952 RepID=A0A178LZT2_9CHLR|nr:hypothetical protein [Chloroflexus islandicus]OAN40541.1 hypothetical protein A6A03_04305 [Chloroflexus islandicus]